MGMNQLDGFAYGAFIFSFSPTIVGICIQFPNGGRLEITVILEMRSIVGMFLLLRWHEQ
jgi:hypothetical protein